MAQYERKTDSREFEIFDPTQSPTPRGDAALDATDIAIRLWIPDGSDRSQTLTWNTESVLIYMIADLLCATGGRLSETDSAGLTGHFDNPWQALVAARRIQTSIPDFRSYRHADGLGAAILIYQPMSDNAAGSGAKVPRALRQATPGQIFLAEGVSQHLHNAPGIEFRTVPALTTDGDQQTGLVELIFDSPKQSADLPPSAARSTEVGSDLPLIGATMIVQSPFERGARFANEGPTGTGDFAVGDKPLDSASAASGHARDLNPVSENLPDGSSSLLTEELNEPEQASLTRTSVLLAAAALAVAVAAIFMFSHSRSDAKVKTPPPQQPQVQIGGTETPGKATSAVPDANPQPEQPLPPAPKPVSRERVVAQKPPAKPVQKRVIISQEADEPKPPTDSEGMTVKDIPRLLELGTRDSGAGNYDQARREFNQVLRLDPSNQAAKDGLRKVALAERDSQ